MKFLSLLNELNVKNSKEPNKFWLALDVSNTYDVGQERLKDLIAGELHGVRGISGSKEILLDFLGVGRNAFMTINPQELINLNDIEKIEYDNPDDLMKNDMFLLYRIFQKDQNRKYQREAMMMNFIEYSGNLLWAEYSRRENAYVKIKSKLSSMYEESGIKINSIIELCEFFKSCFLQEGYEGYTVDDAKEGVYGALKRIGTVYKGEDEWYVHSNSLKIPKNSVLSIGLEAKVYNLWKSGQTAFMYEKPIELMNDMMTNIIPALKQHYNVRLMNMDRFAELRFKVKDKRKVTS